MIRRHGGRYCELIKQSSFETDIRCAILFPARIGHFSTFPVAFQLVAMISCLHGLVSLWYTVFFVLPVEVPVSPVKKVQLRMQQFWIFVHLAIFLSQESHQSRTSFARELAVKDYDVSVGLASGAFLL